MRICRWDGLKEKIENLLGQVDAGEPAAPPFPLLAMPSSPRQQLEAASQVFRDSPVFDGRYPSLLKRTGAGKLRLGYFSSDLYSHATAHLIAGMFEAHDRSQFEIIGFAFGGDEADPMRQRIAKAFDRLIDVSNMPERKIADMSRELGIHIGVDLKGHTKDSRPRIFAPRAAPIQVNYLGYPGTMGAACFDYIIGDPVVTPREHSAHFSERIVSLPHCYQVNDSKRHRPDRSFSRRELGLPEKGFVFCCFNNSFKILPGVFDIWMRLLIAVEGSVLWLLEDSPAARKNLRTEAQKRNVSPDRLVFATRVPVLDHLARHRAADLFLDTFPYNAHTTASDALWMGLPLLTRRGETFAGRVAASLLTAIALPELIAESDEHYESRARALATRPEMLASVKRRLEINRQSCPLFDTARYTRNIEAAYQRMWQRYESGVAPEHFTIVETAT
jgi:predicted O-linked N-acetylglucosamine transferase (SPINDLY family)